MCLAFSAPHHRAGSTSPNRCPPSPIESRLPQRPLAISFGAIGKAALFGYWVPGPHRLLVALRRGMGPALRFFSDGRGRLSAGAFVILPRFPFESCTTMAHVFRFAPRRLPDWNTLPQSAAKGPVFWPAATRALWPVACNLVRETAEKGVSSHQSIANESAFPATVFGLDCRSILAGVPCGNRASGTSRGFEHRLRWRPLRFLRAQAL